MTVLALSGGVGGAKLAVGLAHILPAEDLLIVSNEVEQFVLADGTAEGSAELLL